MIPPSNLPVVATIEQLVQGRRYRLNGVKVILTIAVPDASNRVVVTTKAGDYDKVRYVDLEYIPDRDPNVPVIRAFAVWFEDVQEYNLHTTKRSAEVDAAGTTGQLVKLVSTEWVDPPLEDDL